VLRNKLWTFVKKTEYEWVRKASVEFMGIFLVDNLAGEPHVHTCGFHFVQN
jgi:hypothetical protein